MLALPRYPRRLTRSAAKNSGFTLVELLTVVTVIMILVGITVGVTRGVHTKQSNARARAEINAIGAAIEMYKATHGTYPRLSASDSAAVNDSDASKLVRARLLFEHLTGQKYWKYSGGSWSEQNGGRAFLDPSQMTVDGDYNSSGNSPYFIDPWGKPYDYIFIPKVTQGGTDTDTSGFFMLYSHGSDKVGGSVEISDYVSADDYFNGNASRADDIVYELENN